VSATWLTTACARAVRVRVAARSPLAATSGRNTTTAALADLFAVQDEITEAIVATIEAQLYATESIHAQRKPPGNMDAWDPVIRARPPPGSLPPRRLGLALAPDTDQTHV